MDLCSRALPADVAHIRGAGLEGVPLVQGQQKAVHGVASLGPPGLGIRCVVQIILAAHARRPVTAGIGPGQAVGKGQLLRRVTGDPQGLEISVEDPLQGVVRDGVRQAVDEFLLHRSLSHQSCALGDLVHPGLQLHGLRHMIGPDHVQYAGPGLDHVGTPAAGIGDGVVDPSLVTHVLPQELDAHVHQLHRVQGAAATVRVSGGMGRHAGEVVLGLDAGVGGAGKHLVGVVRVPGEGRIQTVP